MDYTVSLTATEVKCLEFAVYNNRDWIEESAKNRAEKAQTEILKLNTDYCNKNGIAIAVGIDAQVTQAYNLGVVKTWKQVTDAYNAANGLE